MGTLSERCADFGSCCCSYMGACVKKTCYGMSLQWCPYSFGKTVAVIPFWPFVAIFLVVGGGITILIGVGEVTSNTSGTKTEDDLIKLNNNVMVAAYGAIGYLALVNLLVTYSVFASKLRIHNINCLKAECSGFMETADTCKAKCCACICKGYDYFVNSLAWLNTVLSIGLTLMITLVAAVCYGIYYMCELDYHSIDVLLAELQKRTYQLNEQVENTFFDDLIVVSNTTNSTLVCENKSPFLNGGTLMLIGAPAVLIAQVMVLLSYNVVTEVALRHMKDFYREKEPLQEFNQSGPDPDAMARARMAEHAYSGKRTHGPGESFNSDLRGGGGAFGAGYPDIESERGRCESTQL